MSSLNRTILKEFQATNFKSFSDGQLQIRFPDEADLTRVEVVATPNGGHYEGGTFVFEVCLPPNYPDSVAQITCKTMIFHPNIAYNGRICFNILNDEWNPSVRLVDYAHALLWLLYQPNLDSRLNGDCPTETRTFHRLVRQSLQGKVVKGVHYPRMIEDEPEPEPVMRVPSPRVSDIIARLNRATATPIEPPRRRMSLTDILGVLPGEIPAAPAPPPPYIPRTLAQAPQPTPPPPERTIIVAAPPPVQPITVTTTPQPTRPIVIARRARPRTLFVPVVEQTTPTPTPSARPAARRWPSVNAGVRFVNGSRAY